MHMLKNLQQVVAKPSLQKLQALNVGLMTATSQQ